ncbi:glycosyltransferase [Cryobacterium sp. AP23]
MAHIVLSIMPFAGHVAPATGLVAELVARGHQVTVYTGAHYRPRFEALGAAVHTWRAAPDFDEHNLPATFPGTDKPGRLAVRADIEHVFVRTLGGQARDLVELHREHPIDLLLGDVMSFGTGPASELLDVPWVTMSFVPLSYPTPSLPLPGLGLSPGQGGAGRARDAALRQVFALFSRRLDRVLGEQRAGLGLPPRSTPLNMVLYSPRLTLASGCASLDFQRTDLPDTVRFVGWLPTVGGEHPLPDWWAGLGERPVVLVTQGTLNINARQLVRPALEALADVDVTVLATTGGVPLPFPAPANALVADFVPFDAALALADVVISNGGWGGTVQTLARGVPIIVAGGDRDKPEVAARVHHSGAGLSLHTGRPSARAVRAGYDEVVGHPRYRARAGDVAAELHALGGTGRAVDLVEEVLTDVGA